MADQTIPDDLMDAVVEEKPPNVDASTPIKQQQVDKPVYDTSGLHLQNVSLPSVPGHEPIGESMNDVPVTKGTHTFGDVVDRYRRMAEVATAAGNVDVAREATMRAGTLQDELKTVEQFSTPTALATSLAGGALSKLGKVGKIAGTGAAAYFAGTGIKDAATPQKEGEDEATALQRRLSGGGQAIIGSVGAFEGAKPFKESPKFEPEKGYQGFLKAFNSTDPEFKTHIDRLAERGHLTELSKNIPKNFIEANKSLRDYMDNWEKTTIDPAIERHDPNSKLYTGKPGFVNGDNISRTLSQLKDPQMDTFFPGSDAYITEEQGKFVGKQIPLVTARELLAKLNSYSAALEDMSPEDANAAKNKSIAKDALDTTADAVRNELYSELSKLGEKGIREGQKDYGAMKELKKNIYNNIPHAEKSEATKPSYSGVPMRSITRHPMITGGMLLGSEALHHPEAMAVLPAVEALKTYSDRANTPNELLKKSYKNFAGGPQVQRPTFVPPKTTEPQVPPTAPIQQPPQALPPVAPPQATLRFNPATGQAIPSVNPISGQLPPTIPPSTSSLQSDPNPVAPFNTRDALQKELESTTDPARITTLKRKITEANDSVENASVADKLKDKTVSKPYGDKIKLETEETELEKLKKKLKKSKEN